MLVAFDDVAVDMVVFGFCGASIFGSFVLTNDVTLCNVGFSILLQGSVWVVFDVNTKVLVRSVVTFVLDWTILSVIKICGRLVGGFCNVLFSKML